MRPAASRFVPRVNPQFRATLEEVAEAASPSGQRVTLLYLRSWQGFQGMPELDDRPGHIPGALHLVWQELVDGSAGCLKPAVELQALLSARPVTPQMPVIAYCRCGARDSVGCLALKRLGCQVRLYDGSYLEWMNRELPVEYPGNAAG